MKNKIDLSWNSIDVISHLGINFTAYFLFLTILGAEDYAIFIFISLVCGVFQSIAKLGQNDYLIVTKKISEDTFSGVFTFSFLIGFLFCIVQILIFLIIAFFTDRSMIFIISSLIMAFSVFISISSNIFLAILQKNQNFKKLFILNLSASIISIFVTYLLSAFFPKPLYPVMFVLGTAASLLLLLLIDNTYNLKFSKVNLLRFIKTSKNFMVPLAKTRPIMVISKNIDSFMVILIGGDILLVAYNTSKKILVYPFSILYGILDRWLYPLMAKLDNLSEVSKVYNQFIRKIIPASIIASATIIYALSLFDNKIIYYFNSIGIDGIDVMLICYGFVLTWPLFVVPALIYPYAKVAKKTLLLPNLAIFQALSIFIFFIFIKLLGNHSLVSFSFLIAYLFMNIYIFVIFKFSK